jgi:predicted MPP superfamily phosphohydrolase
MRFFAVTNPGTVWGLRVALGLLSISLVLTSLLAFRYLSLPVRFVYTASAGWLGILYLLILASAIAWVIYGLATVFHFPINRRILMEVLLGIALLTSLYGFINAATLRTTRVSVQIQDLPVQWKGKTAVWVSDFHLGQVRNYGFSQKIGGMIQHLKPDILFVGGDLYDGVALDRDRAIEPLSRISAPYGKYFITGNHEQFREQSEYLPAVRRAGFRVLNNEMIEVEGLQIIGVGYRESRGEQQFRTILKDSMIDRRKPALLLKHAPFHLNVAEEEGVTFQISGHTHQGQVLLFRHITARVYQGYDYGLKKFGRLLVYTSSGAGTWGPPMRVDTVPEIVVVKFE